MVRGPLRPGPPLALGRLGIRALEIDGAHPGDNAGFALAGLGDVDGDHRPALAIGAATADPHGRTAAGELWVIEGIP